MGREKVEKCVRGLAHQYDWSNPIYGLVSNW